MSARMLTEDLISSAKRRTLAPISQQTFQDPDIISFLNEEMAHTIVPEIMAVREDMWLTHTDVSYSASEPKVRIPERAIGESLKMVFFKDAGGSRHELVKVPTSRLDAFSEPNGDPSGFFLEGSYIHLMPMPANSGTLEIWYYRRPSELVPTTDCGLITVVGTLGANISLDVDNNLVGLLTNANCDIVSGKSPFMSVITGADVLAVTSTNVEFLLTSAQDGAGNTLAVLGDYVCLEKTSNIPQIPQEFHAVLAQSVACRILEALGDINKLQAAMATRDRMLQNCLKLIQNRIEGHPEYINNKFGFVNSRKTIFNGGGYSY